jgi:endonuclease/exonuclease/phosphatase family metal-dependent hydrolase
MICRHQSLVWQAIIAVAAINPIVSAEPLRVMTFNVRYGTADDGDNRWELRKEFLLQVIREFDADVLGVQEALRDQVDAIGKAMPTHGCVGVGREADGGGEYSAVFYRRSRFDVMAAETFWLSDTPETPGSRSWGNTLPRIGTLVRLIERPRGRRFTVINTHWDHESQPARLKSGALMAEKTSMRATAGDPLLVLGDFNSAERNPSIAALTQDGHLLRDTFRDVHPNENEVGTAHAFSGSKRGGKIDHIFATSEWRTLDAAIVHAERDGRYPSDHFPVTAIVELDDKE